MIANGQIRENNEDSIDHALEQVYETPLMMRDSQKFVSYAQKRVTRTDQASRGLLDTVDLRKKKVIFQEL